MRPGVFHRFCDLCLEPPEVLPEKIGELRSLLVVVFAALPGTAGVEEPAIDSWDLDGYVEAEERVLSRLGIIEPAADHGAHHLAGGGDVYAAPDAVGTTGPAGVDQVAAGAVRAQPLGEHLGVGRLELGGVGGEEVVGGLRRR